jgi:hypothetical protein
MLATRVPDSERLWLGDVIHVVQVVPNRAECDDCQSVANSLRSRNRVRNLREQLEGCPWWISVWQTVASGCLTDEPVGGNPPVQILTGNQLGKCGTIRACAVHVATVAGACFW